MRHFFEIKLYREGILKLKDELGFMRFFKVRAFYFSCQMQLKNKISIILDLFKYYLNLNKLSLFFILFLRITNFFFL